MTQHDSWGGDLSPPPNAVTVLVDADASPVKEEIYRVAERHGAHVRVVSNQMFRVPVSDRVKRVTVSGAFDAADDWIAAHASPRTLVVTGDILLADRALKAGATVLAHTGKSFDAASIGSAVATRAIMATCAPEWTARWAAAAADRRRSARRIARGSCRRWTGSWCGWGENKYALSAINA